MQVVKIKDIGKCGLWKMQVMKSVSSELSVHAKFSSCSIPTAPHHSHDIDRLESVQRMFTKRLRGYQNLSYSARRTKAGLSYLELRRIWYRVLRCCMVKLIYQTLLNCSLSIKT